MDDKLDLDGKAICVLCLEWDDETFERHECDPERLKESVRTLLYANKRLTGTSSCDVFHVGDCLHRYDRLHAVLNQIAASHPDLADLCLTTVAETYLTKHHEAANQHAIEFDHLQNEKQALIRVLRKQGKQIRDLEKRNEKQADFIQNVHGMLPAWAWRAARYWCQIKAKLANKA